MQTIEKVESLKNQEPSNRVQEIDDFFKKVEKIVAVEKPSYTIPPKDTIGRNIYSLIVNR